VASFSVLESGLGRALPLDDAGWDIPAETLQEWLDKSAAVLSHAALGAVAVLDLPLVVIDGAMPPALRDALIAATAAEMARMRHHGITLPTLRAGTLAESDTFWQTRTGELILDLGRLPTADPFSWTAAGHPWTVNSWGFDVLLAWAYRSGGLPAIALAGAVLAFLAAGLVLLVARRLGAGPLAATVVVQGAALAQLTFLSVRPQLVDYCVIPVLVLLTRGVTRPAAQLPARLVGLGALATVWVNLHSTAVMGVPLLAAAAVATAVWRPAALGRVGAALAVYTLGVMVNPAGPQILAQAVTVARESTGLITEWSRPELTSPAVVAGLVAAAAAAVVTWRSACSMRSSIWATADRAANTSACVPRPPR
jgi:predicted NBD/HSP70 family sugar kinase